MAMPIRALAASSQREPDLQRDLIPVHLSTIYVTPNLPHLEPAKVPQRARCLGYRVLNRFRDALLRSSDNVHNLLDWIRHLHSPWIVSAVLWPDYSLVVWRRPKLLAFRRLAETVLPELLWSKTIVLRDI